MSRFRLFVICLALALCSCITVQPKIEIKPPTITMAPIPNPLPKIHAAINHLSNLNHAIAVTFNDANVTPAAPAPHSFPLGWFWIIIAQLVLGAAAAAALSLILNRKR
jgi:hypothetical protein